MRIIAGKYRGRKLIDCSKLKSLRPTTDSNRENLFNILQSSKALKAIDFKLENCDLLDVFCGSGAVSFEALSRGIRSATLIDNNFEHLAIAKKNAELLVERNIEFLQMDALKITPFSNKQYNLIFIDPPYKRNMIADILSKIVDNKVSTIIKKNAVIVIEAAKEEDFDLDENKFELLDKRKYGKTVFYFLTAK